MLGCQRQVSYFAGLPRRKLGHVHGNSQSGKVNRDIIDVYMRRKYQVCDKYDVLIFPLKKLLLFFADLESTLIFFVSPHALLNALEDACSVFGPERRCCLSPSQAARQVATDLNVPKKRVYNLSLQLKN